MKQIIRDGRSRPIAQIVDNIKIFDATGSRLLATYNAATNTTYKADGRLLGKGNLLLTVVGNK